MVADGLLGSNSRSADEVRQRAAVGSGIKSENIMVAATHTHSTPETSGITDVADWVGMSEWVESWLDGIAQAVIEASGHLRPARIAWGRTEVAGLACNRRDVLRPTPGFLDQNADVVMFEGEDSDWKTIVFGFACHLVTVQVQPLVSADFPGVAMATVENDLDGEVFSMYLQGACGDVNPLCGHSGSWSDVEVNDRLLGDAVTACACDLLAGDHAVGLETVESVSVVVELPSRQLPDLGPIEAEWMESKRLADGGDADAARRATTLYEQIKRIRMGEKPISAELQVLRLGPLAIVGIPGELCADLGQEIRQKSAAPFTVLSLYSNGYLGYNASLVDHALGGYEVGLGR